MPKEADNSTSKKHYQSISAPFGYLRAPFYFRRTYVQSEFIALRKLQIQLTSSYTKYSIHPPHKHNLINNPNDTSKLLNSRLVPPIYLGGKLRENCKIAVVTHIVYEDLIKV